ncbi:hypothetical protein STEG23_010227 [Scotinomys teguina]
MSCVLCKCPVSSEDSPVPLQCAVPTEVPHVTLQVFFVLFRFPCPSARILYPLLVSCALNSFLCPSADSLCYHDICQFLGPQQLFLPLRKCPLPSADAPILVSSVFMHPLTSTEDPVSQQESCAFSGCPLNSEVSPGPLQVSCAFFVLPFWRIPVSSKVSSVHLQISVALYACFMRKRTCGDDEAMSLSESLLLDGFLSSKAPGLDPWTCSFSPWALKSNRETSYMEEKPLCFIKNQDEWSEVNPQQHMVPAA